MNHDTVEVLGDEQVVTGVKALNQNYKWRIWDSSYGFLLAIGHKPNTDILKTFSLILSTLWKKNIAGVLSGDAADHVYIQGMAVLDRV
jgi:thioredoxin reductase (NADPH)